MLLAFFTCCLFIDVALASKFSLTWSVLGFAFCLYLLCSRFFEFKLHVCLVLGFASKMEDGRWKLLPCYVSGTSVNEQLWKRIKISNSPWLLMGTHIWWNSSCTFSILAIWHFRPSKCTYLVCLHLFLALIMNTPSVSTYKSKIFFGFVLKFMSKITFWSINIQMSYFSRDVQCTQILHFR